MTGIKVSERSLTATFPDRQIARQGGWALTHHHLSESVAGRVKVSERSPISSFYLRREESMKVSERSLTYAFLLSRWASVMVSERSLAATSPRCISRAAR